MFDNKERNIKDILGDIVGSNKRLSRGIGNIKIEDAWKEEMGEVIVRYTERLYLKDGFLHVNLSSAPLRDQLSKNKRQVIENLNTYCGQEILRDIIFR